MSDEIRTNIILMGRYQVQGELGRGGMGSVYLAYDLQHRRSVAIKVARLPGEEARAQFRREALYLQKLHHHSLPRVLDTFSDDQRDFLVMEYIPGDDLESLVQRQGPQPEWLVLRWADELLDVLDYLHTQTPPIIHRDVKPGNLKLRQNDTLVLVDFGIAREYIPESTGRRDLSAISPGFSPPEQYSDQITDARTDVYAAGATFYYLLTGHAPAPAPERQSGGAGVAPVSKVAPKTSQPTEKIVTQALELEPEARWNNAAEMRRSAAAASRKLANAAPPPAPPEPLPLITSPVKPLTPAPAGTKRRTGLAAALGLAGVALLAIALFLWMNGSPSASPAPTAAIAERGTAVETAAPATDTPLPASTATEAAATLESSTLAAGADAATAGGGPLVVSTLVPVTATMLLTPTATLASSPTATFAADPTKTVAAAQSPTATSTPKAVILTQPAALSATLLEPQANIITRGVQVFSWQSNRALSGSEAFELVFWKQGQDAMSDSRGPAGTTQGNQVMVDLDAADKTLEGAFDAGDNLWGVLLVETTPNYRRLRLVSEGRLFQFQPNNDSGGSPNPG